MGLLDVAIVGAAGFVGGELLRILLGHPDVHVRTVVSGTFARRRVDTVHPNLRGITDLAFGAMDDIRSCDVVFLATGQGESARMLSVVGDKARVIVDLAPDFRLKNASTHERYYPQCAHQDELAKGFVPGIPELHRERLRTSDRISVPGCMATAAILALHPLASAQLVEEDITIDARTGSSGAGASVEGNLHAERSGAMRVFAPLHHRHEAEVSEATGLRVQMSATGVEAVRGVQVLCRVRTKAPIDERRLWSVYRDAYRHEPFVRLVAQRRGAFRYPEPKILAGSNFCDIGFAYEEGEREIVVIAALDNLVKGSAGAAAQCMNVRFDLPERRGLEFPGLHPVG